MSTKARQKVEFGDFQTPDALALSVCNVLRNLGAAPNSIVEPTCGKGAFLRASARIFPQCAHILGFEVNPDYVQAARSVKQAEVRCRNFFAQDWPDVLNGLYDPVLVVGNPPWVTNSAVGALGGANLPAKSNSQHFNGFDALTGKSNFDISEWMLLHLLECLSGREATLAMLCKTVVARKVLCRAWSQGLQVAGSAIYRIDAGTHFGAAVDACLLMCVLAPGAASQECTVYPDLESSGHEQTLLALRDGRLVADLDAFNVYGHMAGLSPRKWRSGIKHDCTRIMELRSRGNGYFENGLGEVVRLETTCLYPMLKSSELTKPHPTPSRYMLVTQRAVGEATTRLAREAPKTWDYLQAHADRFDGRASSIYRNRPRFSVFGVGAYSFAPWKVAISGFYKRLAFRCVGPIADKPVVFDDTCYFLPCHSEQDARLLLTLLNSEAAKGFFRSFVFWDAKRPITAQLLASLDLGRLAQTMGVSLPVWSEARPEGSVPLLFSDDTGARRSGSSGNPRPIGLSALGRGSMLLERRKRSVIHTPNADSVKASEDESVHDQDLS